MSTLLSEDTLRKLTTPASGKNPEPVGALAKAVKLSSEDLQTPDTPPDVDVHQFPAATLAREVMQGFERARQHKQSTGVTRRIKENARLIKGEYTCEEKSLLAGTASDLWFPLTQRQIRVMQAFVRNILNSAEHRLWDFDPTEHPEVPEEAIDAVTDAVIDNVLEVVSQQGEISLSDTDSIMENMVDQMEDDLEKEAKKRNDKQRKKIDDQLSDVGFMVVVDAFVADMIQFPFAILRGPVGVAGVRTSWKNGKLVSEQYRKLDISVVSPDHFFWSPDSTSVQNGTGVYEIRRLTRSELDSARSLKGFLAAHIDHILQTYSEGHRLWAAISDIDSIQQVGEGITHWGDDEGIDCVCFSGRVSGTILLQAGMDLGPIEAHLYYEIETWVIDDMPVYARMNNAPGHWRPYTKASAYPQPGKFAGMAIPDTIESMQRTANSCLRGMISNLAYSSAPIFELDISRLAEGYEVPTRVTPGMLLYSNSLTGSGDGAILTAHKIPAGISEYSAMLQLVIEQAELLSGLPRYFTGAPGAGGAARTLGGLATLQNNASVGIRSIVTEIDAAIKELITRFYIQNLKDETNDDAKSDSTIIVFGATHLLAKSVNKGRLLEAINVAAPFMQAGLIDPQGTSSILRELFGEMGLDPDDIVIDDRQAAQQAPQLQSALGQASGVAGGVTNTSSAGV